MKKRMLIAFALIAILATSAFAADFSWGGNFTSVWAVDMGSDATFVGLQFGSLSANVKLDDNNTVTVVLEYADNGTIWGNDGKANTLDKDANNLLVTNADGSQEYPVAAKGIDNGGFSGGEGNVQLETANLRTDIFGALGLDLPVTLAMNNGFGRLNLHDRFAGEGMGWNFETFKGAGSLDMGWGRYIYTGFDLGIMDMVNVRLYTAPGTFNDKGANFLIEAWAPIAIADIMTLDIGAFLINNGQEEKIMFGWKVKADMSFGIVALNVWLGGTFTNNAHSKEAANKEVTDIVMAQGITAKFAFNDAMGLKVSVGAREDLKARTGDALTAFNDSTDKVKAADPGFTLAFDLAFNYAAFTVYGGIITTDLIVHPDIDSQKTNGRWDFGVGYEFGAANIRMGVTGPFVGKDIGVEVAGLPGNDGLAVCAPAATMMKTNDSGTLVAELYFSAMVWF